MSLVPQKNALSTCARIFPKLERLFLHTPQLKFYQPHLLIKSSLFPNFFIHDAITNCRFDELPLPLFEIECEHVIYKPHKDEIAGTVAYITLNVVGK